MNHANQINGNSFFRRALLMAALILLSSCSREENENDVVLTKYSIQFQQISYGTHPEQIFDLYLPIKRSSRKTKVIVLIHGGGWVYGDKESMNRYVNLVLQSHPDHAIVNMNYVLSTPERPAFPNQLIDIQSVISKLTKESSIHNIKPEFAFIGSSAGAHLSLLYESLYDDNDQVKLVVDIVGHTNFTDPFFSEDPQYIAFLKSITDQEQYPPNTDINTILSPALQATHKHSPTVMFYGNNDSIVPLSNGYSLHEKLNQLQIPNTLIVFDGNHGDDWGDTIINELKRNISEHIDMYLPID